MTEPESPFVSYELVGSVPSADDLDITVRKATTRDGTRILDVREHVPSTDFYGRGITALLSSAPALAQLIATAGGQ